jgi:hypothetical protein
MADSVKPGTWGRDKSLTRRSRARIAQGARDVESGMKDTERRGIPSDIAPAGPGGEKQRKKA